MFSSLWQIKFRFIALIFLRFSIFVRFIQISGDLYQASIIWEMESFQGKKSFYKSVILEVTECFLRVYHIDFKLVQTLEDTYLLELRDSEP